MHTEYTRLIRVSLIYAAVAFLVFACGSLLAWGLFPYPADGNDLAKHMTWVRHVVGGKIGGMILICFLSYFAAGAHRPTWKLGVITAVVSTMTYQLIAIVVYLARFGFDAYRTYHALLDTVLMTIALSILFGFLAVWKQYRQEKEFV